MRSHLVSIVIVLGAMGCGAAKGAQQDPDLEGTEPAVSEDAGTTSTSEDSGGLAAKGSDKDTGTPPTTSGSCTPGATQACHPNPDKAGIGICDHGTQTCEGTGEFGKWGPCEGAVLPKPEECDGALDENCDGKVDEGCGCTDGDTKVCPGSSIGICKPGMQTCVAGKWGDCEGAIGPKPEICGNKLDDDCDGKVDEDCGCDLELKIDLKGDCLTVSCPKEAPYPVGCDVKFSGDDDRGCVAYKPGSSTVFFKEGNVCSAGSLSGTLKCSCTPGAGINAANCAINKSKKYYPTSSSGCPS